MFWIWTNRVIFQQWRGSLCLFICLWAHSVCLSNSTGSTSAPTTIFISDSFPVICWRRRGGGGEQIHLVLSTPISTSVSVSFHRKLWPTKDFCSTIYSFQIMTSSSQFLDVTASLSPSPVSQSLTEDRALSQWTVTEWAKRVFYIVISAIRAA